MTGSHHNAEITLNTNCTPFHRIEDLGKLAYLLEDRKPQAMMLLDGLKDGPLGSAALHASLPQDLSNSGSTDKRHPQTQVCNFTGHASFTE